jgi:uncharacterized protein
MEQFEVNQEESLLAQRQAKRILNRSGLALFLTAAAVLLSQMMIELWINRFYPSAAESDWYVWCLTAVTMVGIGLPLFWLLMKGIPDSPKGEVVKLSPLKIIILFFICISAMYITNILSGALTIAIAYLKGDTQLYNPVAEAMMNGNFIISLIYASIIAPITEELIFRKLLLDKLRRFGDVPAILMTGIAFGLFHMNLSQMFYAAVLGFIFAYITIKTNTIRYSILLHILVNFLGTGVSQLSTMDNWMIKMAVGQWVIASIIAGIILFVFQIKKITFKKADSLLMKKSAFIFNPGTILYVLVCSVMIVIITIS